MIPAEWHLKNMVIWTTHSSKVQDENHRANPISRSDEQKLRSWGTEFIASLKLTAKATENGAPLEKEIPIGNHNF